MSEPLARIDVGRRPDGRTLVAVTGEIDLTNAADVARSFENASHLGHDMVVDLRSLEYLDSQGVRILQHLIARHADGSLDLIIVAPRRSPAGDILSITRLTDVVPVVEQLD